MQEILVNALLAAVALLAAGLLVWARGKGAALRRSQRVMLARILASSLFLLLLQVLGPDFFSSFGPAGRYVRLACYMFDYLLIGYDILREAARNIRNGQVLDENFLMAIATVGAFALAVHSDGDYLEAIAVMLFYQVGEWFQSYAVGKSRKNISELMDIRPDYANIERGGKIERVDPGEVAPGSVIVVMPGEKVPLDGVVAEGSTTLDTAALTGESVPRDVGPGDEIVSGCVNMTGLVKIRTTKAFGESTVSKILDLVENASSRKSRSEAFISRFAKVYTPAVCGAALLLAVVPPVVNLILGNPSQFGTWLYRALTFLVASCPCALVISIPLTFFAGLGGASKEGILVKGSNYLEALSKTTTVVFDKTGTLTKGAFSVTGVHHNSMPEEKLLELAAHAESSSSHPIGKCIVSAWGGLVDRTRVRDVEETGGNGVVAAVDGMKVACGNDKLMARLGVECAPRGLEGTVVHVAVDGAYAGQIVVDDTLKPNSAKAIQALKAAGVTETVMLTGDGEAAAARVAGDLGISRHYSNLLPGDKVAKVEELLASKKKGTLAFVGDGINDAPVLSRADIGIAMGALGSDAAIEASDVVLMDDDPLKIAKAIRISRKCLGIVYQNIVFAIGVKLACLVLVAVGLAGMWLAVFADVGVMVLAVLNAIRALFVKKL